MCCVASAPAAVTVVLVEPRHAVGMMKSSDRLLVLDAGRLIADGSPHAWRQEFEGNRRLSGTPEVADM